MFYTYICYWNILKYIIQITFHVAKQSHARVTSFTLYFFSYFRFVSTLFYFIKLSSTFVV